MNGAAPLPPLGPPASTPAGSVSGVPPGGAESSAPGTTALGQYEGWVFRYASGSPAHQAMDKEGHRSTHRRGLSVLLKHRSATGALPQATVAARRSSRSPGTALRGAATSMNEELSPGDSVNSNRPMSDDDSHRVSGLENLASMADQSKDHQGGRQPGGGDADRPTRPDVPTAVAVQAGEHVAMEVKDGPPNGRDQARGGTGPQTVSRVLSALLRSCDAGGTLTLEGLTLCLWTLGQQVLSGEITAAQRAVAALEVARRYLQADGERGERKPGASDVRLRRLEQVKALLMGHALAPSGLGRRARVLSPTRAMPMNAQETQEACSRVEGLDVCADDIYNALLPLRLFSVHRRRTSEGHAMAVERLRMIQTLLEGQTTGNRSASEPQKTPKHHER